MSHGKLTNNPTDKQIQKKKKKKESNSCTGLISISWSAAALKCKTENINMNEVKLTREHRRQDVIIQMYLCAALLAIKRGNAVGSPW